MFLDEESCKKHLKKHLKKQREKQGIIYLKCGRVHHYWNKNRNK
ncbi:hypothetical protein M128_3117 [Bacteroides fragilis str. S6L8]|nr:hypothetical protein M130_3062 [Bacteroides fragilis str. S6R6]EYA99512.1 hypothetical protein M128_3117 [Bacteroides fragilis str. S6L8]EYB04149.1 hypothetical protein M129_3106 [Bacteroides fragilis str. S6R5]